MNTEIEIRKARDYLGKHRVKQILSRLLTDTTMFRPKEPIPFFIDRLKHYALISDDSFNDFSHSLYQFPRIFIVVCPNAQLCTVVKAFSIQHNFELLEKETTVGAGGVGVGAVAGVQDQPRITTIGDRSRELVAHLEEKIQRCMRDTVNETFLALNSISNMNDLMLFEQTVHEVVSCVHVQVGNADVDSRTNSVLSYFAAQNKLCTIRVNRTMEDSTSLSDRITKEECDEVYELLRQVVVGQE